MTFANAGSPIFPLMVHQPASPSIWPAVQLLRRGLSTNPEVTMWCICGCSWRDDVCCACECYKGSIVVMDIFWRWPCVSMIWESWFICSELVKGATSKAGKYIFRPANALLFAFRDLWKELGWLQFSDPYRTAGSTTGGWSRWNSLMGFIYIYIILSTTVSHFWTLWMSCFLQGLPFYTFPFLQVHFACVLCI